MASRRADGDCASLLQLLPALLLTSASATLLAGAALWPVPGQSMIAVFPVGVDASDALNRLMATPDDWRLRGVVATLPLTALVLSGTSDASTLRRTIGAWFVFRASPGDCAPTLL